MPRRPAITHAQCWAHSRRRLLRSAGRRAAGRRRRRSTRSARCTRSKQQIRDAQARGREQATAPAHPQQAAGRAVLRLGRSTVRAAGLAAEQPADQGVGLRARAPRGAARCSSAIPTCRSTRTISSARCGSIPMGRTQLAVLLDRGRRQARGHRAEPDRDLPAARHRSVHLPGRRPAARRSASGLARRRTHAAAVEAALRRQPAALDVAWGERVGKDAGGLPLTLTATSVRG